jgi:prepilin-type processing-associated H-X9-DG protein
MLNAFNDWFKSHLSGWTICATKPGSGHMESRQAPLLIQRKRVFGEKRSASGHVHMDMLQSNGNDLEGIDHRKHSDGSNVAFADGSVTWLRHWLTVLEITRREVDELKG